MTSDRLLWAAMQALVVLDVVFVHLTGAAAPAWLVPLYALALGAPLLAPLREKRLYRVLWNAGVLACFVGLVRHALRAELSSVLEDGLVLAAFCQVHLLNNLRSSQQPDLLFFNAFLIAIVAAFMSPGAAFAVAFLAFAPAFVVGLEMLGATRGGRRPSPAATRRLAVDGARRAGWVLAGSLVVFAVWPRDFDRRAFFHGRIEIGGSPDEFEVGFNERLELDRRGDVDASDRPALRVTLLEGATGDVPVLWRGATLGATDAGAWRPFEFAEWRAAGASDELWGREGATLRRGGTAPTARVRVVRLAQGTERLFAPLGAVALEPADRSSFVRTHLDGTLDVAETGDVAYELELAAATPAELGGAPREEFPPDLAPYALVPEGPAVQRALALARGLVADLPEEIEQAELVETLADHLSRSHPYVAPGAEGAARSLEEFLATDAGGHCEFFASALATMLRGLGVPCRVVTGYRSARWEGDELLFALRDAHAWVEVHDPLGGWYAVDPSPLLAEGRGGEGLWDRLTAGVGDAWTALTGFDAERRAAALGWVRALPARAVRVLVEHPGRALAAALALGALLALRHARRLRRRPAVHSYRRAVRRAGLRPEPGETPRELLERARSSEVAAPRLEALESATRVHESARYAV